MNEILNQLYNTYFNLDFQDNNVSSHWKGLLCKQLVEKKPNGWAVKGQGFGNFIVKKLLNNVRFFPEVYLSKQILERYNCSPELKKISLETASKSGRLYEFDCDEDYCGQSR